MMKYLYLTGLLLYCHAVVVFAQDKDSTRAEVQEDLEQALEDFDPESPEFNNERLVQYLQDLADQPVNINTADTDILLQVPGINLKIGRSIIEYRSKVKPFERVDELVNVPGIGAVTLEKVRPYVTVGSGPSLGRTLYTDHRYWTYGGRTELYSRFGQTLEQQEGYRRGRSAGGYLGSAAKYYQRLRYKSNHLSLNLTQEKDPGEPLTGPGSFDYTSWHIALEDNGKLRKFVAGDFGLSFGQGLVLWDGGAFGKGREVTGAVNRNERGVSSYSSAREAGFHRGAAVTYGGRFQVTGFYSHRKRTASVIRGDTIRFPKSDGYHRTVNELNQRNNTRQKLYGGRLRMELPFGFLGATAYQAMFNRYIKPGSSVYNRYDFSGSYASAVGVDYSLMLGHILAFGEVARSRNGGYGVIAGIESPAGKNTDVTLGYRRYSKDFQSIMGNGFGESSGEPQNELGVYLGVRHAPGSRITLSGYIDQYRFPAPRFGTHQPTRGYDWLGLIDVRFSKRLQFYLQARSETKEEEYEETGPSGRLLRKLDHARRTSLRIHLEYQVNPKVRLRARGEAVKSRKAGEKAEHGYLLYQDIRFTPGPRWKADARITVFDTESFNTRVYQFENDLLYVLSNQMLFEQGQRLYLLLNYKPFDFMEIWGKFGITIYEDRHVTGSGLDEIQGNRRSDIRVQVRIRI